MSGETCIPALSPDMDFTYTTMVASALAPAPVALESTAGGLAGAAAATAATGGGAACVTGASSGCPSLFWMASRSSLMAAVEGGADL